MEAEQEEIMVYFSDTFLFRQGKSLDDIATVNKNIELSILKEWIRSWEEG